MARLAKRKASTTLNAKHRMSTVIPIYSTVEPTFEEKQLLPERFRKADEWPVTDIIAERAGKYLVEWEAHPNTGAIWKPEWKNPSDISNDLITCWREQERKDQAPAPILTQSPGGLNQLTEGWEEARSKRRRLTQRTTLSGTSVSSSAQETRTSDSTQTSITRKRQNRLVILSSSPTNEIQETQQFNLNTTDSIQVDVPQADRTDLEKYETIPTSSTSLEHTNPSQLPSVSSKDQEADSALGLSSPIDEGFVRDTTSSVDQEEQATLGNASSRFSFSGSQIPISSAQNFDSQIFSEQQPSASRKVVKSVVQSSDPIEATASSIRPGEAEDRVQGSTQTTASSPLFYPEVPVDTRTLNTDGVGYLNQSQSLEPSQLIDASTQQPVLGSITSQTSNCSSLTAASYREESITQNQDPETSVSATPSSVLRQHRIHKSSSQNQTTASHILALDVRKSTQPLSGPTNSQRSPQRSPPIRKLPRAKLFQYMNLSSSPQRPSGLPIEMSARSRESSPRIRRSAPPVEGGSPSLSLRETLIKQTAPARALQQARHERNANRSISRTTSTATDSTRNSIPARTANTSPNHPQTSMSSSQPSDDSFNTNGTLSSSMQVDESDPALASSMAPATSIYNSTLGSNALLLHPSIEDEQSLPRATKPNLPSTPILGPGEYVVPLPVEGKIKDHYLECIRAKRRSVLRFTRNPKSTGRANMSRINAEEAEQMRRLIDRLNDTTTHLDLGLDGPATQYSDSSMNEAIWTYYASSKFAFLHYLIEPLRRKECCITIVAKEGLTLDLLEKFMKANHVKYRRPHESDAANADHTDGYIITGLIQVDLIAFNEDIGRTLNRRPTIIVAFDTSFDVQDTRFRQFREECAASGSLIPIIYPMIINSAEHVDICIPKSMPSPQRFQMLVQTVFRARDGLGGEPVIITSSPPIDLPSSMNLNAFVALKKSLEKRFTMIAEAVARAVIGDDFDSDWVIPPVALELEPLSDTSSGQNTARSTSPQSRAGTPSVQKRLLERDSASSISSKRQRRAPAPDVTHISNSLKDSQSQIGDLRAALRKAEQNLAEETTARTAAEERLAKTEKQLEGTKSSLGDLQTRYETRMKVSHQLKRDIQNLKTEKENVEKRHEKVLADNTSLKEQCAQIRAELIGAREVVKGTGGSVADVEIANEEVRKLTERNLSLEKSYANTRKDFEFTRSQYQEASTKAAEFATQLTDLESKSADLKRQASDEKRRLKELNYKTDLEQHLARIGELELTLKNRDVMLQRKEEELKAVKKSRGVATRGSSVQPGSPRPAGSRGGSPAPGSLALGTHAVNRASALRHER